MQIAGLDIGTTGCKLTVFNEQGTCLGKAYRDYPVSRGKSEHEVDATAIREGVFQVIKKMSSQFTEIRGIGITSFGETFVLTDDAGEPLLPSMLYTDPRGAEECASLIQQLGKGKIEHITGLAPHEMYSISKIMWVKKHRPDVYERVAHVFLIEDYIVYLLTGISQIDYSLATRTMAFDIRKLQWSEEIFTAAKVDINKMSKPVPTGSSAGDIATTIAKKLGLSIDTIIVSVSHDQVAAAIGAGAFESGSAVDGAGTVECMTPVFEGIPKGRAMYDGKYAIVPYVIPGTYVCYAFSYTGGALIQWCVDTLGKQEKELAKQEGRSVNEVLEADYTEEPTGLLVLPHFAGAATPYMDTGSKGAIIGLTTATTVNDIYQACMEGVVYEMLLNMERLKEAGITFQMLYATGGGAKSAVWMQMKADILNMQITALATSDAGTVGSAMLTGIAVGCYKDLKDAALHMVEKTSIYYPRKRQHERYLKLYEHYKKLYDAVRPLV